MVKKNNTVETLKKNKYTNNIKKSNENIFTLLYNYIIYLPLSILIRKQKKTRRIFIYPQIIVYSHNIVLRFEKVYIILYCHLDVPTVNSLKFEQTFLYNKHI